MALTLTKAWDPSALLAGLKSTSLANAPKAVSDLFSIVFGWIIASLVILATSNPLMSIVASFVPSLISAMQKALLPSLPGLSISAQTMSLTKAWDTTALLNALKASEIPDLSSIVNNDVGFVFQWAGASLAMGSALEVGLAPIAASLGAMVVGELQQLEAKA